DDGDDIDEGTGDEEFGYRVETSLFSEDAFTQVDIDLEAYTSRQQGTFSFFDGDGIVNLGLIQVQVQSPYPPEGEPAVLLAIEVDDVFLTRVREEFDPADFDEDGDVDVNDLLGYLGAFRSQSEGSDFDGNGVVNVNDLLGFLGAFRNAGSN